MRYEVDAVMMLAFDAQGRAGSRAALKNICAMCRDHAGSRAALQRVMRAMRRDGEGEWPTGRSAETVRCAGTLAGTGAAQN